MSHQFPKRAARAFDAINDDNLTTDFAQAAERLARVQKCNIAVQASDADRLPVRDEAFHAFIAGSTTVPVGFGAYGGSGHPNYAPNTTLGLGVNHLLIPNDFTWLEIASGERTATGVEQWVMDGWAQYLWVGFSGSGDEDAPHDYAADNIMVRDLGAGVLLPVSYLDSAPNIQFGLRVDGEIVFATGFGETYHRAHEAVKPDEEIQDGEALAPGLISDLSDRSDGPGHPAAAVHLVAQKRVFPGTHRWAFVVRRLPESGSRQRPFGDQVAILNRQHLVQALKIMPVPSRSPTVVETQSFAEGNELSANKLKTTTLDRIKARVNALTHEELTPMSVGRKQVVSPILPTHDDTGRGLGFAQINEATARTIDNWMFDETDSTPSLTTAVTSASAVHMVSDGAGNELKCAPVSGFFHTGSGGTGGVIKVFGRLQIQSIINGSATVGESGRLQDMAQICLYYKPEGGSRVLMLQTMVTQTRAAAPNLVVSGTGVGGPVNGWPDIALFGFIDTRESLLAANIEHFGIAIGGVSDSTANVDISYRSATLSAIHFRG